MAKDKRKKKCGGSKPVSVKGHKRKVKGRRKKKNIAPHCRSKP